MLSDKEYRQCDSAALQYSPPCSFSVIGIDLSKDGTPDVIMMNLTKDETNLVDRIEALNLSDPRDRTKKDDRW